LQTGLCQIDFTGLQQLFLVDITLRVTIQTCSSETLVSSYSVECIGTGCAIFSGLNPCDTTNQCISGTTCVNVPQYLTDQGVNASVTNLIFNTDWIELILSSEYASNLCTFPSWANTSIPSTESSSNPCFGTTKWQKDLHNFVLQVAGVSSPNTVTSVLQYCLPSLSVLDSGSSLSTWAQGLVTVNTNQGVSQISLSSAFKNVVSSPSSTPTPSGGVHSLAAVAFPPSVVMLLVMVISLLLLSF